jgi:membrane fusion protein, multidrug efflux system
MSQDAAPTGHNQLLNDNRKDRRWRFWAAMLALILLLCWIDTGFGRGLEQSIETSDAFGTQSIPVGAAAAKRGDLNIYLDELGTVSPSKTVIVHTRVDGELVDVYVREGQTVKAGDLLAEIDPRPYQIRLAQAEAQMARDRAFLVHAQAQLARYKEFFQQDIISRLDLDTQQSLAGQYARVVTSDQALIDSARLNLAYCRITSPINGRVGLRLVDTGNTVHAFDTQGLMVIRQFQPVTVIFSIPEDDLQRELKATNLSTHLPVDAYDRGFRGQLATGTLLTLDNEIDQTTGTLKLKASFSNTDNMLFPGESVNIKLPIDTLQGAVLIPAAGVQRSSQGTFVYVVKPD